MIFLQKKNLCEDKGVDEIDTGRSVYGSYNLGT